METRRWTPSRGTPQTEQIQRFTTHGHPNRIRVLTDNDQGGITMNGIERPNKTFVLDKTYDHFFGRTTQIVIIAASDKETAAKHINEKLGFEISPNELVSLTDANYKTIYDEKGQMPLEVQAKILYNTSITRHE